MVKEPLDTIFLDHLCRRGAGSIHALGRGGTEALLDVLSFKEGESILELGCGTGETLVRMAAAGVRPLFGLDNSESMVDCARRRCGFCRVQDKVEIQQGVEGSPWPFESGALDVVFAESVMAILDRGVRRSVVREVARVLKTGGRFLFSDSIWRQGVQRETIMKYNERCCADFGIPQATVDWVGPGACERELNEFGLDLVFDGVLAELPKRTEALPHPVEKALLRSRLFTFQARVRAMLSPVFLVREFRFKTAALRLREVGRLIEPRLVVARRN